MRSIEIDNIKSFTSQLFIGTWFDKFLVTEASFSTFATFTLDGHLNPDFLGEEDMALPENSEGLTSWGRIRPLCFSIIKGRKVPSQFKIIFKMPADITKKFLADNCPSISPEGVGGLFLNVNYRDKKLSCVTGSALKVFSMDKNLDLQWDDYMAAQLKKI